MHYISTFISVYIYLIRHLLCVSSQEGLGQFCFLIFVAYSVFSAAFMLYFVPETKGKTMVEIMEDFNKLNYKNRAGKVESTNAETRL